MGRLDFLAGAGKAIAGVGKDAWHSYDNTVKAGQHAVGGVLKGVDALVGEKGVAGKSLEHLSQAPATLLHANQTFGNAGVAVGTGVAKAGVFTAQHPWDAYKIGNAVSKKIIMDQITNPLNIAALVATGGSSAAMAGFEGVTEAASAIKSGSSVMEGVQQGLTAVREGRSVASAAEGASAAAEGVSATSKKLLSGPTSWTGSSQAAADKAMFGSFGLGPATGVAEEGGAGGSLLGRYGNARANAFGSAREALTGSPVGRLAEGRSIIGDQVASRGGAFYESLGQMIGTSPGAPEYGGRLAELRYNVSSAQSLNQDAQSLRTGLHVAADPKAAAMGLGKHELATHKGDLIKFGEKHATDTIVQKALGKAKDKLFGSNDDSGGAVQSTVQQPQAQVTPGLSNWSPESSSGFVATPRTVRPGMGAVTTTTQTSTDSVGPTNWYGGQNNYSSGRGFAAKPFGTTPWQKDPAYT